jgi:very-short-patch-repair endonuclease
VLKIDNKTYFLDFAVYCVQGKLNLETDGDAWHSNKERAKQDNLRDNLLKTEGWRVLRFNTHQVREDMGNYCIPIISKNINRLGGLSQNDSAGKLIKLTNTSAQLDFFD